MSDEKNWIEQLFSIFNLSSCEASKKDWINKETLLEAELWHAIYACRKGICFQSQQGQTKFFLINQGKHAQQCVMFSLEIFLFKIENACVKKLKPRVKNEP